MDKLIALFPTQLREAIEIGMQAKLDPLDQPINKVYVAGMGGSGVGADFVADFIRRSCTVPYIVRKAYDIPHYIDAKTLVIASSFSGNTEETIHALQAVQQTGARIVVVSSGGKLIEIAKEHGYNYFQLPDHYSSPRACLGYSIVQQLSILYRLGIIPEQFVKDIRQAADLLDQEKEHIQQEAKEVAKRLYGKIPVLYTSNQMGAVGLRLKQQINENAKQLCLFHVVPEMNHNELVGWRQKGDWAVLFMRSERDLKRNKIRMDINREIISEYADTIMEVYSKGTNLIEESLYLVHLGDWISYYLSVHNEVDSIEVDVIDFLKAELGKQ